MAAPVPIVFISSTAEDLKRHRQAARDAATQAGWEVAGVRPVLGTKGLLQAFDGALDLRRGCLDAADRLADAGVPDHVIQFAGKQDCHRSCQTAIPVPTSPSCDP